ncbi:MAG: radical SAM family heme chaperone HemW [Planctomycetota bacterium]|nr:radical SAM family heme chaperone HemW [Planctomycetota bacterium]
MTQAMPTPTSVYVHVPFCRHRCGYCNFTLVAGRDELIARYLQAIELEISKVKPGRITTLFLGGGTPTHLAIPDLERLLNVLENKFEFAEDLEFSIEGNPVDFDRELVDFLAARKVSRVSLGGQSYNPKKLEFLERDHDENQIGQAIALIESRIKNCSLDLILGVPGETLEDWSNDLGKTIQHKVQHVSTYSLTIEKGTRFWNRQNKNRKMTVDETGAVELYQMAITELRANGYRHYEVSNFSKPGYECQHNINYWNGGEYYGFGPGASRYVDRVRATNHQSTSQYLKLVSQGRDPTVEREEIDNEQSAREKLIFGLRQIEGFQLDDFSSRTGYAVSELVGDELRDLCDANLLEVKDGRLRLTLKGLLVSDSLWPRFL